MGDNRIQTFDEMLLDWKGISQDELIGDIDAWKRCFHEFVERQQQLRASGQWISGPSDLLGVIGKSRRETYHSAVLAWLLDPGAPHGLSTRFLEAILKECRPKAAIGAESLASTVTECEVARSKSRADIVVWSRDVTIVVEAKVDHVERPEQCDDLYADFREEQDALFVFLTPDGRKPKTATHEAADEFCTLSFRTIRSILHDTCENAGSDAAGSLGWHSVLSYLRTLEVEFP